MIHIDKTFEQCAADPVGTVYHDEHKNGYRFIVLRGPNSLCAYLGVPQSHPLAQVRDYNDLPLRTHGGLTFSGKTIDELDKSFFWWGWDYDHLDDFAFYYLKPPLNDRPHTGNKWTPEMVVENAWEALYDFERLIRVAEKIAGV